MFLNFSQPTSPVRQCSHLEIYQFGRTFTPRTCLLSERQIKTHSIKPSNNSILTSRDQSSCKPTHKILDKPRNSAQNDSYLKQICSNALKAIPNNEPSSHTVAELSSRLTLLKSPRSTAVGFKFSNYQSQLMTAAATPTTSRQQTLEVSLKTHPEPLRNRQLQQIVHLNEKCPCCINKGVSPRESAGNETESANNHHVDWIKLNAIVGIFSNWVRLSESIRHFLNQKDADKEQLELIALQQQARRSLKSLEARGRAEAAAANLIEAQSKGKPSRFERVTKEIKIMENIIEKSQNIIQQQTLKYSVYEFKIRIKEDQVERMLKKELALLGSNLKKVSQKIENNQNVTVAEKVKPKKTSCVCQLQNTPIVQTEATISQQKEELPKTIIDEQPKKFSELSQEREEILKDEPVLVKSKMVQRLITPVVTQDNSIAISREDSPLSHIATQSSSVPTYQTLKITKTQSTYQSMVAHLAQPTKQPCLAPVQPRILRKRRIYDCSPPKPNGFSVEGVEAGFFLRNSTLDKQRQFMIQRKERGKRVKKQQQPLQIVSIPTEVVPRIQLTPKVRKEVQKMKRRLNVSIQEQRQFPQERRRVSSVSSDDSHTDSTDGEYEQFQVPIKQSKFVLKRIRRNTSRQRPVKKVIRYFLDHKNDVSQEKNVIIKKKMIVNDLNALVSAQALDEMSMEELNTQAKGFLRNYRSNELEQTSGNRQDEDSLRRAAKDIYSPGNLIKSMCPSARFDENEQIRLELLTKDMIKDQETLAIPYEQRTINARIGDGSQFSNPVNFIVTYSKGKWVESLPKQKYYPQQKIIKGNELASNMVCQQSNLDNLSDF